MNGARVSASNASGDITLTMAFTSYKAPTALIPLAVPLIGYLGPMRAAASGDLTGDDRNSVDSWTNALLQFHESFPF